MPMLVAESGMIIAGHGRLIAACSLAWLKVAGDVAQRLVGRGSQGSTRWLTTVWRKSRKSGPGAFIRLSGTS